jgi:hypothetical protein
MTGAKRESRIGLGFIKVTAALYIIRKLICNLTNSQNVFCSTDLDGFFVVDYEPDTQDPATRQLTVSTTTVMPIPDCEIETDTC